MGKKKKKGGLNPRPRGPFRLLLLVVPLCCVLLL